jgi:hypothetical protein
MEMSAYVRAVTGLGYKTEGAATAIVQNIAPFPGSRVAIRAFGFTCGATATTAYFMVALGQSAITNLVASGATTGFVADAEFQTAANAVASADYVAIEKANGDYHFTTIATGTYAAFSIAAAAGAPGAVAAGGKVFGFGVAADTGHYRVLLTINVQTARALEYGLVYGAGKGSPMIVYHANNAAAAGSIDYVAVDYINK